MNGILLLIFLFFAIPQIMAQTSCESYFTHSRRSGNSLRGQLEVPMALVEKVTRSKLYSTRHSKRRPLQVRVKLNRPARSLEARRTKAREMGSNHKEFMIENLDDSGEMYIMDISMRLRSRFAASPKIIRIVLNEKTLCGDPPNDEELREVIEILAPQVIGEKDSDNEF